MRTWHVIVFALWVSGCGTVAQQTEGTLASSTRVADTLGVVVRYLCDQAEQHAVQSASSLVDYKQRVTKIRQTCDTVADAYNVLADAQLTAVHAAGIFDRCTAAGTGCVTERSHLTETIVDALAASAAAQSAAQGAVALLQGAEGEE